MESGKEDGARIESGMTDGAVVRFEDVDIRVHDAEGNRWVTFGEVGRALGYSEPSDLRKLVDRNEKEFEGKQMVVSLSTISGMKGHRVLNHRGVIRAGMLSQAPRAVAFRDWAEEVLLRVMLTGTYGPSVSAKAPDADERHWTEKLSPKERLELVRLRVKIGMAYAKDRQNPIYDGLLQETYGGAGEMTRFIAARGGLRAARAAGES